MTVDNVYRFGPFEMDVRARKLRYLDRDIALPGQSLDLLLLLLEKRGAVVTREEIKTRLWPNSQDDPDKKINTIVRTIRRALDEDKPRLHYIQTAGRDGYRFIAAVVVIPYHEVKDAAGSAVHPRASRRATVGLIRHWLVEQIIGPPLPLKDGLLVAMRGGFLGGCAILCLFFVTPAGISVLRDRTAAAALGLFACLVIAPLGAATMCYVSTQVHDSISKRDRSMWTGVMLGIGGIFLFAAHLLSAVPEDLNYTAEWYALFLHGAVASTAAIRTVDFLAVSSRGNGLYASIKSSFAGGVIYSAVIVGTVLLARLVERFEGLVNWNWRRGPFVIACTIVYLSAILLSLHRERRKGHSAH